MHVISIFGKEFPLSVFAMILIVSGAGAAVGLTTAGTITGESTTAVDQTIIMNTTDPGEVIHKPGTVQTNGDGTQFRTAAEVHQGDTYDVRFRLDHRGQTNNNGELILKVPEPLNVGLDGSSGLEIHRVSPEEWMFNMDPGTSNLTMTIQLPNDAQPGYYTIEGEIRSSEV